VGVIDLSAERRLVKSPPELWAEISDPEAMAKHLGEFGEIRITRVEPEHTVAWEGELAKGTARIESSGWGTKVVLTAEIPEPGPEIPEPAPEPEPAPPPEPEPAAPPQPGPVEPAAGFVEAGPDLMQPEPDSVEPEPPERQHDDERMSLLARLFGVRWAKRPELQHLVPEAEREAEEQSEQVQIEAEPQREPESGSESEPPPPPQPQAQPEPQSQPQPEYTVHPPRDPEPEPEEVPVPEVPALDPERARAVLDGTLEALGAAHHRPFSRV
jgi:hypothetical protein